MKFTVFKGAERKAGSKWKTKWYFRLTAANGKIVAQSQGYTRLESAMSTIKSIKSAWKFVIVIDRSEPKIPGVSQSKQIGFENFGYVG